MTELQQRLETFIKSSNDIFCVLGEGSLSPYKSNLFYHVSNPKRFCIDHLLYKRVFSQYKILVIEYSHLSVEQDIIITDWLQQCKKIVVVSSIISEDIITYLQHFSNTMDVYKSYPRYEIVTSYHNEIRSLEDIHVFIRGFLLTSTIHEHKKAIIFLQQPFWCDKMASYFSDSPYKVLSLHARHLKSQFCIKSFSKVDLIFTTNIHKYKIPYVRWILDFSNDSKMKMCQRTALAGHDIPCDIFYFTSANSLSLTEIYPYDWKLMTIHGILTNNIGKVQTWSSSSLQVQLGHLEDCKILKQTDQPVFTDIIQEFSYEFIKLLDNSPFSIEYCPLILHLYKMSKNSCMPEIMKLMITMCISIIDIMKRYGKNSFFSLPTIKGISSSSVMNTWTQLICTWSSSHGNRDFNCHLLHHIELVFTVMMTNDKQKFHIDKIIWLRFMERWKYLYSFCGFQVLDNNKTSIFEKKIRKLLRPHMSANYWDLEESNTYWSSNIMDPILLESRKGSWYSLVEPYSERLYEYMWKLSDFSDWTPEYLQRYNRRWFVPSIDRRELLEIDRTIDLYIPIPLYIVDHVSKLKTNIEKGQKDMELLMENKKMYRMNYSMNVVEEIKNEVAYRPYMVKYLETMKDFYDSCLTFSPPVKNEREEYFEYLDDCYKKSIIPITLQDDYTKGS